MIRVKTTIPVNCKCGSWINHWNNCAGKIGWYCSVDGCTNLAITAAHVSIGANLKTYVVPVCDNHLEEGSVIELEANTVLVPTNSEVTCVELATE